MRSKILVVEDEAAINDLICLSLETAGYETVSFRDGGKAGVFLDVVLYATGNAVPQLEFRTDIEIGIGFPSDLFFKSFNLYSLGISPFLLPE